MAEIGYFMSCEEQGPASLLEQARLAEGAGFSSVWISDHYLPWLDEQGESPFVWGVIGAIGATTSLQVTTAVTCPTVRIHPAVVAQAAATSKLLCDGRFRLGVGSGEALNEHVLGDRWGNADQRLAMLEEAVEVMRALWSGEQVDHQGEHYVVDRARLYSLPDEPVEVPMSAFGPKATEVAARIADGFISTSPDDEMLGQYRSQGGQGPSMGGLKVCWGTDTDACIDTAHRLWRNSGVPGELTQELPVPAHFDQASQLVNKEMVADTFPCGPDPERYVEAVKKFIDAGFDEVYVNQIGGDFAGFFDFFTKEVQPRL